MTVVDSILIEKLRRGNREAFLLLYEKYVSWVYNYALALVKNSSLAQDITQECFLKVWQSRHKILPEGNFPAWLYVVARNSVLNELRRLKYADIFAKDNLPELQLPWMDDEMRKKDHNVLLESIWGVASGMPESMRQIFFMRYREEMSVQEIADCLGLSRKTVETQLMRAVKRILKKKSDLL